MLELSKITCAEGARQSPIRKIMGLADRKNIINLGLNPDEVISFAGGWVNHEAPTELLEEYQKISHDKALFHKLGGYSPTEGDLELRKALLAMDEQIFGITNLTEKNIIVGQSSTQLTFGIFQALLDPLDKVVLFDPTYANYPEQLHSCQRTKSFLSIKIFDENSWEYMKDENEILSSVETVLKKEKPKLILLSSPDNPTGQVLSDHYAKELLELALRFDCFVAFDEAYRTQYYVDKQPKHFSFSPAEYENLINIHSNSKWCRGLGRRLGWIEANEKVVSALKIIQQVMILCPDSMHQFALTNYIKRSLDSGSLEGYLQDTREKYKRAAEAMSKNIEKYLGFRYLKPTGGLYTVADVGMDSEQFVLDVLRNTGVIFVPGTGFGESLRNGIRISFGPLVNNLYTMKDGFLRVRDFLEEYSSERFIKQPVTIKN